MFAATTLACAFVSYAHAFNMKLAQLELPDSVPPVPSYPDGDGMITGQTSSPEINPDDQTCNDQPGLCSFTDPVDENLSPPKSGPLAKGLAFIKLASVGGSTFGGVMRRIGNKSGLAHVKDAGWLTAVKGPGPSPPSVWANHGALMDIRDDLKAQMPGAFMVTLYRNPADRCLSAFTHFQVYRNGVQPTTKNKVKEMERCSPDYEARRSEPTEHRLNPAIFKTFDFVAVTERFDESLVLLRKALRVPLTHMLYLKAKESGKAATDNSEQGKKVPEHVPLSDESPDVRKAAQTLDDSTDMDLLNMANLDLDEKITAYGKSFGKDLAHFLDMLATVETKCRNQFFDQNQCLWNDNGCGQQCIDDLVEEHGWELWK